MKIIKRKNENSLINEFTLILKREILKKRRIKKRLSFVLTGGSSPKKLYKKLAKSKIDWSNIDLFWGDERFVSKNSKNSNYKLAYDLLIKKIKIKKKNLFPIKTNKIKFEKSSIDYENKIRKYFNRKKVNFDLFLLGMGNDGHIASLFPGSKSFKKKFIATTIIRKDFKRITLSLDVINKSKKIILWLNNRYKSKAFDKKRKLGKEIPVNNLNKKNMIIYKIH